MHASLVYHFGVILLSQPLSALHLYHYFSHLNALICTCLLSLASHVAVLSLLVQRCISRLPTQLSTLHTGVDLITQICPDKSLGRASTVLLCAS